MKKIISNLNILKSKDFSKLTSYLTFREIDNELKYYLNLMVDSQTGQIKGFEEEYKPKGFGKPLITGKYDLKPNDILVAIEVSHNIKTSMYQLKYLEMIEEDQLIHNAKHILETSLDRYNKFMSDQQKKLAS
ncbi:hypothetical protein DID75_02115 [Candidatus Marinamargulisbacteria bacterium SCGC AG-410-N11]|nr:hypothetical protein DID75_02115 [Candidatus Marinamargulisbacteria bacterium SCGC AG-410-N11]